jgi:hypothetical protein
MIAAELSEPELLEYDLLMLSDEHWGRIALTLDDKGAPLIVKDEQGKLVINDPVLAEWDAKARANAEALEKKLADAFEVKLQ